MRIIFAVGGDMRLRWMVQILSKEGYPVSFFTGTDSPLMKSAVKEASVILGPFPLPATGFICSSLPHTVWNSLPFFLPYARTVSFLAEISRIL